MAKLVVIIVNWNTKDLTRDCLNSLLPEITDFDSEVWVVDNASNDGSVEMLKTEFPCVRLLCNEVNVGFARANNQVLRLAHGEYYLLLNTDTSVPKGSISALLEFLENNSHVAAVGPLLKDKLGNIERGQRRIPTISGELRYCLAMHFPPFEMLFRWLFGKRQIDNPAADMPVPSEVLSAACLLLRYETVKKIGLLSEDYFLFSEENDYFLRMKQAGLTGYFHPGVFVYHLKGMSRSLRARCDSEINFFKSRKLFFRKFYKDKYWLFKAIYGFFLYWSLGYYGLLTITKLAENEIYLKYKMLIGVLRCKINE